MKFTITKGTKTDFFKLSKTKEQTLINPLSSQIEAVCPYSSVWIERDLAEVKTGVQILVGALILRFKSPKPYRSRGSEST